MEQKLKEELSKYEFMEDRWGRMLVKRPGSSYWNRMTALDYKIKSLKK